MGGISGDPVSAHPYGTDRWEFKKRKDVHTARTTREHAKDDVPVGHTDGAGYVPSLTVYVDENADVDAIEAAAGRLEPSLAPVEPRHNREDELVFVAEDAVGWVCTD